MSGQMIIGGMAIMLVYSLAAMGIAASVCRSAIEQTERAMEIVEKSKRRRRKRDRKRKRVRIEQRTAKTETEER